MREGIDLIFERYDSWFEAGQFEEADCELAGLDVPSFSDIMLLAFLSISACAKDKLPNRKRLLANVTAHFREKYSEDRVVGLIYGL